MTMTLRERYKTILQMSKERERELIRWRPDDKGDWSAAILGGACFVFGLCVVLLVAYYMAETLNAIVFQGLE